MRDVVVKTMVVWLLGLLCAAVGLAENGQVKMYVPTEPVNLSPEILKQAQVTLPETPTPQDYLALLCNHTVMATTSTYTKEGKISYLVASASASNETLKVTQDYINYRSLKYTEIDGTEHKVRWGVGIRNTAYLATRTAKLDTSSLFSLGVSASRNTLDGYLFFDVLGITGEAIAPLVPTPAPLTKDSVNSGILALATLKAKLYNATTISPVLLAEEVLLEVVDGRGFLNTNRQKRMLAPPA